MSDDENFPELWKNKKTVNIPFEHRNNLFLKTAMLKKKHTGIEAYIGEDRYKEFLNDCNKVLQMAHISMWWWILLTSLGLGIGLSVIWCVHWWLLLLLIPFGCGCIVILFIQRVKTRRGAKKLAEIVDRMNEHCRKIRRKKKGSAKANERLVFQLPLPSIPDVLVTAVFQEKRDD